MEEEAVGDNAEIEMQLLPSRELLVRRLQQSLKQPWEEKTAWNIHQFQKGTIPAHNSSGHPPASPPWGPCQPWRRQELTKMMSQELEAGRPPFMIVSCLACSKPQKPSSRCQQLHWVGYFSYWCACCSVGQLTEAVCTRAKQLSSCFSHIWLFLTLWTVILEWITMSCSKGSSQPRDQTCVSYVSCIWQASSLPLAPPGISTGAVGPSITE